MKCRRINESALFQGCVTVELGEEPSSRGAEGYCVQRYWTIFDLPTICRRLGTCWTTGKEEKQVMRDR